MDSLTREPSVWQVSRVLYPGLAANHYFPRVQKLFGGQAGGVVTFELLAGAAAAEMMFQVCSALLCSAATVQLSWIHTVTWLQETEKVSGFAMVPKQGPDSTRVTCHL